MSSKKCFLLKTSSKMYKKKFSVKTNGNKVIDKMVVLVWAYNNV